MLRLDLKPCPFCGGIADMWRTNYHVWIQCENFMEDDSNCHMVQVSADTEKEAVRRWEERYDRQRTD